MKAPEKIETPRLVLRRPGGADAANMFARYASDIEVTRYLAWPAHVSIEDTKRFLAYSAAEWERWPAGPYLIESRSGGQLLGSTGLAFDTATIAATGYLLARDAWGRGYATEALGAMVTLAHRLALERLYALCHAANSASIRVLEKCGFQREAGMPEAVFPNLVPGLKQRCLRFSLHPR